MIRIFSKPNAAGRHNSAWAVPLLYLMALMGAGLVHGTAAGQVNFTPLERGDYEERDEELIVLRGMTASGEFAVKMQENKSKDLRGNQQLTQYDQDFRLHINSVLDRDVSMHLELDLRPTRLNTTNIRDNEPERRNRLTEEPSPTVNAREAYLRYLINPNSPVLIGKHEISLGDRRGKTFNGIVPGVTLDCRAGTWCMPLGGFKIGERTADWVFHWALEYTAWKEETNGMRDTLQVEIFRILYTEQNIPLGTNLGPTYFDSDDPTNPSTTPDNRIADNSGNLVYYDAREHNYYGVRINWEQSNVFINFDVTGSQGKRRYHRYHEVGRAISGPLDYTDKTSRLAVQHPVAGVAVELEVGYRQPGLRTGLRIMNGTGDSQEDDFNGKNFRRGLLGYYEIVPGSYQGTRLYFNGVDNEIDAGAGLGHSINNTRLIGMFLDYDLGTTGSVSYSGGIYQLSLNHSIVDSNGDKQSDIGIEVNNRITWRIHKAVFLQLEANALSPRGAFRFDDFSVPDSNQELYIQSIARLVYRF